jgi:mono/diheme cytochrome c family protein
LIKSGDPTATRLVKQYPLQMPDLGLSSPDIDAVLAYIAQQSGNTRAPVKGPAPTTVALPQGDAAGGRELFIGRVAFHNGGPPCMSCHSISGIGALGGGTLGPDLTNAQEIANLVGFIKEGAVAQRPPEQAARLAVLALIGVIILVVIGAVYWRRRLVTVRKALVTRANTAFLSKYAGRL